MRYENSSRYEGVQGNLAPRTSHLVPREKDSHLVPCFLYFALLLLLMSCSLTNDDDGDVVERVKVGDRVPQFTVKTVDPVSGEEGIFSSLSFGEGGGRGSCIVFFHTSCRDCQRELPRLNSYYLKHKDEGLQMVAISRAEGRESVAAFWAEHNLVIPYSAQEDRRIYELFASSVIPRVYFCSPEGIVTRMYVEVIDDEL